MKRTTSGRTCRCAGGALRGTEGGLDILICLADCLSHRSLWWEDADLRWAGNMKSRLKDVLVKV